LDLFSTSTPAPNQGGGKQSALDDLLSLGLGSNGTNGTATNGTNAFTTSAPITSSNPFADMFASPAPKTMGFGGNGFGGQTSMGGGMQMGMGAQQQQPFYQQQPTIQQPFGGNNMNSVFGSNNDQGKI
jgi:hypothetical protein